MNQMAAIGIIMIAYAFLATECATGFDAVSDDTILQDSAVSDTYLVSPKAAIMELRDDYCTARKMEVTRLRRS